MSKGTLTVRIIGDAKSFNDTMGKVSSKVGGLGKTLGKAALGMGAAAGAAGAGLFAMAQQTANYGDEVAKGARATGLATDAYQELKFAFGQAGIEGDKFRNMMRTFNKQTGEAENGNKRLSETFDTLGVSLRDANGEMRSQDDLFTDALRGLEGMTSSSERAAAASQLFGARIGGEMASAIDVGVAGIDELRQKAHDLGAVMSEEAAVEAEAFNDRLDDLKQTVGGLARGAFTDLVPAFTKGFENLAELGAVFKKDGVAGLVGWIKDAIPPMLEKARELGTKLVTWARDTALPWLAEKLAEWGQAFADWAVEAAPPMLAKLGELLRGLSVWLADTALPAVVDKLKGWAEAFVEWVGPALSDLLPKLGEMLGEMLGWMLTEGLPKLIKALAKWGWAFLDFIVTGVIPALPGVLGSMLSGILAFVGAATGDLGAKLGEWAGAFVGWIAGLPSRIATASSGLFDGIKDAFRNALNWIIRKWNDLSFTLPEGNFLGRKVGGGTLGTPNIPELAAGGIVTRPTLALIGEAGPEAVVPLSRGRGAMGGFGGGATINVYMPAGADGDDVVRALRDWQRRNGPLPVATA